MRDFCKFSPKFWIGQQAKHMLQLGPEAILLSLYLRTNHHTHSLGIYYLPLAYIAHDTGVGLEEVKRLMKALERGGFCYYDEEHSYVWVVDYALEQAGGHLKESDNRVQHLQSYYESLPALSFLEMFHQKQAESFHLKQVERNENPYSGGFEVPVEPLRSKETEKETEKETKTISSVASLRPREELSPVHKVFEHWKQVMSHPQAHLDSKRRGLIQNALKLGYNVEELCDAVTGCSITPHNIGENDRGQRYDGLHIILRSADQIDRFIRNAHTPPIQPLGRGSLYEENLAATQIWLAEERANEMEVEHVVN